MGANSGNTAFHILFCNYFNIFKDVCYLLNSCFYISLLILCRIIFRILGQVALSNRFTDVQYFDEDRILTHTQALNTRGELYLEDARYVLGTLRLGYSYEMEPYENYLIVNEEWRGWDFKSRWHSLFGRFHYDRFNDGYFPTRGIRADLDMRYVFRGYSIYLWDPGAASDDHWEGFIHPYGVGMASLSWAKTLGERLTLQPTVYAGWCSETPGHVNAVHSLTAGGIQASRYVDYQMPFFGYSSGYNVLKHFGGVAQADLRYRFGRKMYLTLQGAVLQDADTFSDFWTTAPTAWAVGAEFGFKTIGGPLKAGIHWCNDRGVGATFSYGFYF